MMADSTLFHLTVVFLSGVETSPLISFTDKGMSPLSTSQWPGVSAQKPLGQ